MIDTNSPQEECLTASKQTDALTTNENDQRDHPRLRLELLSYGWGKGADYHLPSRLPSTG